MADKQLGVGLGTSDTPGLVIARCSKDLTPSEHCTSSAVIRINKSDNSWLVV